jgi:hypothetical protein
MSTPRKAKANPFSDSVRETKKRVWRIIPAVEEKTLLARFQCHEIFSSAQPTVAILTATHCLRRASNFSLLFSRKLVARSFIAATMSNSKNWVRNVRHDPGTSKRKRGDDPQADDYTVELAALKMAAQ